MKTKTIAYWTTTGLFALALTGSALLTLSGSPEVAQAYQHLQLPATLALLLGLWKAAGVVALLAPRFPRLKEWAYAGFFFNLTGAVYFHATAGDAASHIVTPLVLLSLAMASWATRPNERKLTNIINTINTQNAFRMGGNSVSGLRTDGALDAANDAPARASA